MKYYSEKTKKLYNTVKEAQVAEREFDEKQRAIEAKKEERTKRAKEVETAFKEYQRLVNAFIKDYGSYHMTLEGDSGSIFDILDLLRF